MYISDSLSQLRPESAHLCLDIENFIIHDLKISLKDARLVLALSAGVDSMALLLFCRVLSRRWNLDLRVVHLNHNLREPAQKEAGFVADICHQLGVPCQTGSSNVLLYARKFRLGLEEAARIIRYRFLLGVRKKNEADFLLTAHHLNDLAEDILLRQIRGVGWPGLGGMSAYIPENSLLRPFLLTRKDKLREFVSQLGLAWFEDESNQDLKFQRNRIRHYMMPLFLKENPNFLEQVKNLWLQARTDSDYWNSCIQGLHQKEHQLENQIYIEKDDLQELHPAIRIRWYKSILQRLGPGQVRAKSLYLLDLAWSKSKIGKRFQFPGDKIGRIEQEGMYFQHICRSKKITSFEF